MCEQQGILTIKRSNEPYLNCKRHFHKFSSHVKVFEDFEADIKIDISCTINKTTNIFEQNPQCNGYHVLSELNNIFKKGLF